MHLFPRVTSLFIVSFMLLVGCQSNQVQVTAAEVRLQEQSSALARVLPKGVSITQATDYISVVVPGGQVFASGATAPSTSAQVVLDQIAAHLIQFENESLGIHTHSDSVGAEELNLRITKERARAVAEYLARRGVTKTKFIIYAHGEHDPIDSNQLRSGRMANRRLELVIQL